MATSTALATTASSAPAIQLLVFAKTPIAGRVKTRLAKRHGAVMALHCYQQLLARSHKLIQHSEPAVSWHIDQRLAHGHWLRNTPTAKFQRHYQRHGNLGKRLLHGCKIMQQRSTEVGGYILLGTDGAGLRPEHLRWACDSLKTAEAAMIPAHDGGYVLLAFRTINPVLFQCIHWGSDKVAAQTRQRMRRLGWQWREHEAVTDIDEGSDWHAARRAGWFSAPGIRRFHPKQSTN